MHFWEQPKFKEVFRVEQIGQFFRAFASEYVNPDVRDGIAVSTGFED
jgi:hypothetical protein